MFIGIFMLVVLPLFLFVCAQGVAKSDFGKTGGGKFIEFFFYFLTLLSVLGSLLIIINLL